MPKHTKTKSLAKKIKKQESKKSKMASGKAYKGKKKTKSYKGPKKK